MPKTRRCRADRFWRDTITAWKQSGQSVTAFCAAHGLGESTFFAKRRELARLDHAPGSASALSAPPAFAAVRVIPDPTIEIVIPGGLILRVPAGADPVTIARMVVALRGAPC